MKKSTDTEKLKREYEKVYERPLGWCPLSGYLPENREINLTRNHKKYPIVSKCLKLIEDARYEFFDSDSDIMQKYVCMPDIESLEYPYKYRVNDIEAARRLFLNLDYLKLKMAAEVRGCQNIFPDKQIAVKTPIGRTSNRWANFFSVTAGMIHLDDSIIVMDYLVRESQKISGEKPVAYPPYNHNAKRLYALYVIFEAWLILTSLLFNPKTNNTKDVLFEIGEKLDYVQDLKDIAERCKAREESEPYIKKANLPFFKSQRKKALISVAKRNENSAPKHDKLEAEARKVCEMLTGRHDEPTRLKYSDVARATMKRLSINKEKLGTIRRDKSLKAVVDEFNNRLL